MALGCEGVAVSLGMGVPDVSGVGAAADGSWGDGLGRGEIVGVVGPGSAVAEGPPGLPVDGVLDDVGAGARRCCPGVP